MNRRGLRRRFSNGISVISCTNRPLFMDKVFENYLRQQYPWKELIIILNNNHMKLEEWEERGKYLSNIRIVQIDENVSLGECYNSAIKLSHYNYIAKFDDDDYYAPQYLYDAMNGFRSSNAHIVGKSSRFIYFEEFKILGLYLPFPEFKYAEYVVGATMVIKKEVFNLVSFPDITAGEDSEFQKLCVNKGFKIYAVNKSNYTTIRRSSNDSHTFKMDNTTYLSLCHELCRTDDYVPLIIGNNYDLLFHSSKNPSLKPL